MNNVIKLKYGSGPPTAGSLARAEVGLDLQNFVIYTSSDGTDVVELARNMGEGGTIDWSQIIGIPIEIENIINGEIPEYGTLDALIAQVKANADDIAALQAWQTTAQQEIGKLQTDLTALTGVVEGHTIDIGKNADDIGKNKIAIGINADAIEQLDGRVTVNEDDIEALKGLLDQDLTGLQLGGTYSVEAGPENNTIVDVTGNAQAHGFNVGDKLNQHMKDTDKGWYFIVQGNGAVGDLARETPEGTQAQNGDWLVSDGVHGWILMSFGGDHVSWGSIGGNIENQDDLVEEFEKYLKKDDTIDCGSYT